jgi:hypothetical protein
MNYHQSCRMDKSYSAHLWFFLWFPGLLSNDKINITQIQTFATSRVRML